MIPVDTIFEGKRNLALSAESVVLFTKETSTGMLEITVLTAHRSFTFTPSFAHKKNVR